MSKRNRRKNKRPSLGKPHLDSVFSSGHGICPRHYTVFSSGSAGFASCGEIRKKKKKLPVPPPWPAGEETIIEKDGEFYEVE